ncbi:anaphase-promoting complex subunit 5-domain-containing protein [Blakeslea trispora]|nr:anaphase-promoting complex subunit 5-domain-containing protein [Blakeslea trispora]
MDLPFFSLFIFFPSSLFFSLSIMLYVGYVTPYRITLLVLLDMFCHFRYTKELNSKFAVWITRSILNKTTFKQTFSEPTLDDIITEIESFEASPELIEWTVHDIFTHLKRIQSPHRFQVFMNSLGSLIYNKEEEEENHSRDTLTVDGCSVFGMFIRQCKVEYESMPFSQLEDVQKAHAQYVSGLSGDTELIAETDHKIEGWISDYNVKEFLKWQAERIEKTGTTNIDTASLHQWLKKIEKHTPNIASIGQVRYLNYTRTKEYMNSLFSLHHSFDLSLVKGVQIQYALLNLGILEYKFGHQFNAISALKDASSAARANQDEYCLQEILFWTEMCRNGYAFDEHMNYSDKHLSNMKTLIVARNMLRQGAPCQDVFEGLYKSLMTTIMKDIDFMDRPQFLITSLAWLRYGNSALGKCYLNLANNSDDEHSSIEDIEKTVITQANMLYLSEETDKAIEVLSSFSNRFEKESDLLIGWRKAKALISNQQGAKRTFFQMCEEVEIPSLAMPTELDEYFEAIQSRFEKLVMEKEYDKAILLFDGMQKHAQKTDQTAQLCSIFILKAIYYMHIGMIETCEATLMKAIQSAKRCHDAKRYYYALIKLCETYSHRKEFDCVEKAVYILESIFPKVLLMKNKLLKTNLYETYHLVLKARKKIQIASQFEPEMTRFYGKRQ